MGGSRGRDGGQDPVPTPLENYKAVGYLSSTGLDPMENHNATISQHSMLGHYWPARKTPFKWCFAGGLMMACF